MMMKSLLALSFAVVLAAVSPVRGQTLVSGYVLADTTWDLASSPYYVTSTVFVHEGATLTIEPGVEVLFRPGASLMVGGGGISADRTGTLVADAQGGDPIVFAAAIADPEPQAWYGIHFGDDAVDAATTIAGFFISGSVLRNVRITDAFDSVSSDRSLPYLQDLELVGGGIELILYETPGTVWARGLDIRATLDGLFIRDAEQVNVLDSVFTGGRDAIHVASLAGDVRRVRISGVEVRDAGRAVVVRGANQTGMIDCAFERMNAGAVDILGGGGQILRCEFLENNMLGASVLGGGAAIVGDGWLIQDSVFEGNRVVNDREGRGGGLYFAGENLTLRGCDFIRNTSERSGGGAELRLAETDHRCLIEDCTFIENVAENNSGGGLLAVAIFSSLETIIIRDCVFEGNEGVLSGALTAGSRNVQILRNTFRENVATESGGAVRLLTRSDTGVIADNEFIGNRTLAAGGAIDLGVVSLGLGLRIEGNTFRDNQADLGGAIGNAWGGGVRLVGNAFEANTARLGGAVHVRTQGTLSMAAEDGISNRLAGNMADLGSAIYNDSTEAIDATGVCWGADDPVAIAGMIFDQADDPSKGVVSIDPIATGCEAPCRADRDGDGLLTIFDFLVFQNQFDAGDLAADFDGDGDLTIFDFLAFQNEFDAGCA